ncbi:hypothetical protein [Pantoea sp. B65]|uniref:hypothetical protein n=1 Tax=Pantoea sp. B65 TaxID=2813359 RepID=UPI0039B3D787
MAKLRSVLEDSLPIITANILAADQADSVQLNRLIVPGCFEADKKLSRFAVADKKCDNVATLQKLTDEIYKQGKPIGFVWGMAALIFRRCAVQPEVIPGTDSMGAEPIEAVGGIPHFCTVNEMAVDMIA